ncbi:glycosyltransferase family 4 protein [Cognatiyoonia sp. IB215182]|uniref:glycosyltransferase family 4 protein n=1 Tax=Cognatiyoonia sp. IB215182 TaxID=3097353 RepID=UPI002A0D8A9F|nr:glycosyltransferase family 4 protein [Cognatiyoonia sp. IB215182]MDX8355863.1 glycosyltransferase family 4 protein [Cognatiyoonia sp. IB215182]
MHTAWGLRQDFIGGTERFLIDLAKELRTFGFDAFVVCSNMQPEIEVEGVKVIGRVPESFQEEFRSSDPNIAEFMRSAVYRDTASAQSLRNVSNYVEEQLQGIDADILHLNAFSAAVYFETDRPLVVTNHENELELDRFWGEGSFATMVELIRSDPKALGSTDRLFTPSHHYAGKYTLELGRKIEANPLGTDLQRFGRLGRKTHSADRTVLVPSRFFPGQKGQDVALSACRLLKDEGHTRFKFLFTGVREYYLSEVEKFRDDARALQVEDAVTIKSFASMDEAYQQTDIVVSPERYCSYGLSITESLASGRPTVLTRIPTYLEIARRFPHAHFVPVDDPSALAKAIVAADNQTDTETASILFRLNNDFRSCAERYARTYLDLLGVDGSTEK